MLNITHATFYIKFYLRLRKLFKRIYSNYMLLSIVLDVLGAPILGKLVDLKPSFFVKLFQYFSGWLQLLLLVN